MSQRELLFHQKCLVFTDSQFNGCIYDLFVFWVLFPGNQKKKKKLYFSHISYFSCKKDIIRKEIKKLDIYYTMI